MTRDQLLNLDNSYLALPEVFYARVAPVPVAQPGLILFNHELAGELSINSRAWHDEQLAELFAGNTLPTNSQPLALAYAGHQFGHFTMLGDGRAHLLGEHLTPDGRRVDLQLKGSGPTPFSRMGDGRAALKPMLREYLISQAMAALGIPTTRSLAVVATGQLIRRETLQPGAILTRVADSHLRVGTFEFAAGLGDTGHLNKLLQYTLNRHAPDLLNADNPALALLEFVLQRQATLITHWMRVGFIHGVMNTDNMAICGQTIDYGPCAFMDAYHPGTVFSSIDHHGRYAYANQPAIALWNLTQFAQALLPIIDDNTDRAIELAEDVLNRFPLIYRENWLNMMRGKLGLLGAQDGDVQLVTDLLGWMNEQQADYTNTFRDLAQPDPTTDELYRQPPFLAWHARWLSRLKQNGRPMQDALDLMQHNNPRIIPRNHQVEAALDAAGMGDMQPLQQFLEALKKPYEMNENQKSYQLPPLPSACRYQTFCGT